MLFKKKHVLHAKSPRTLLDTPMSISPGSASPADISVQDTDAETVLVQKRGMYRPHSSEQSC